MRIVGLKETISLRERFFDSRRFTLSGILALVPIKDWKIIADNLSKAGWSWGWVSAVDSEGDEDACRQRQYACNNSRDGKSGDCREADHDQINGKQEHSDVLGEDEVH
jgi:hypothetical protein